MSWVAGLLLATCGTYGIRLVGVHVFLRRSVPPAAERILRHAALGILASLALTSVTGAGDAAAMTLPTAVGLGATVIAARRYGNLAAVMLLGIAAQLVSEALLAA